MTTRNQQPAALRRQIERLERLLEAERERSRKYFEVYSDMLAEQVDMQMRLDAIGRALRGETA